MFPRVGRLILALLAFLLCLVAFVFSVLAITSPEWASRDRFNPDYKPKNWTQQNVIYTLHRSPFIICSATPHDSTVNSTTGGDPVTTTTYTVDCTHFKPYSFDQTSCELEIATQRNDVSNVGDARQCQQIHYAGNFAITSTCFITAGFILVSIAALLTFMSLPPDPARTSSAKTVSKPSGTAAEQEAISSDEPLASSHHPHHHHSQQVPPRALFLPHITLLLRTFLAIGIICALLSQFYAIEGLIQSAPNDGDFTTSAGTSDTEVLTNGQHGPWYQGPALSVYTTCAWAFSLAGMAVTGRTWKTARWV